MKQTCHNCPYFISVCHYDGDYGCYYDEIKGDNDANTNAID